MLWAPSSPEWAHPLARHRCGHLGRPSHHVFICPFTFATCISAVSTQLTKCTSHPSEWAYRSFRTEPHKIYGFNAPLLVCLVCSLDTWWFNALAALPLFLTQPLFLVAIRAVAPIAISTPNLLQLLSALLAAGLLTCLFFTSSSNYPLSS